MSTNTSFSPDEPSAIIFVEHTWLQGAILSSVAYGVVLALFVLCFTSLIRGVRATRDCSLIGLLIYVCVVFALGTFYVGSTSKLTQNAFVDDRNYPGGPAQYESDMYWIPISEFGSACYTLANWAADTLLVWRCSIIYRGCRFPVWVYMIIPCMLLTTSYVMGGLYLRQVGAPLGSPWANNPINYTLLYASISLTLNLFITLMIVGRLLFFRHRLVKALGATEQGVTYLSVSTLLIESAAIYAVFSLMFLIPFGLKNAFANVMLQALSEIQIITSLLIIYRVAEGKAWNNGTAARLNDTQKTTQGISLTQVSHVQYSERSEYGTRGASSTAVSDLEDKDEVDSRFTDTRSNASKV